MVEHFHPQIFLFCYYCFVAMSVALVSCAPPKRVVTVPVEPMPGLATKVYSADDYDWAGKNRYRS